MTSAGRFWPWGSLGMGPSVEWPEPAKSYPAKEDDREGGYDYDMPSGQGVVHGPTLCPGTVTDNPDRKSNGTSAIERALVQFDLGLYQPAPQ